MPRHQSVLVPILACVVSLASISCACAAPVPEPAGGPAPHHAHHQESGAAQEPVCVDSGCGGFGGLDAVVPEGSRAVAAETPVDDAVELAPAPARLSLTPVAVDNRHPPPPAPWRALPTPVSRFDKLLN